MKPLVSPVAEYRLMGIIELIGGAALMGVAIAVQGAVAGLVGTVVMAAFLGSSMYALVYRPSARRAVEAPALAPIGDREPGWVTMRRVLVLTVPLLVTCLLVGAVIGAPSVVAGVVIGNGAGAWWTSRWLRRWEEQTGQRLLREPRWRGRRQDGARPRRGTLHSRGFYVVPLGRRA